MFLFGIRLMPSPYNGWEPNDEHFQSAVGYLAEGLVQASPDILTRDGSPGPTGLPAYYLVAAASIMSDLMLTQYTN